jgi:hypothetical protein
MLQPGRSLTIDQQRNNSKARVQREELSLQQTMVNELLDQFFSSKKKEAELLEVQRLEPVRKYRSAPRRIQPSSGRVQGPLINPSLNSIEPYQFRPDITREYRPGPVVAYLIESLRSSRQ